MKMKCPSCKKKTELSKDNLSCRKCGYQITKEDIRSYLNKDTPEEYYEFSNKNASVAEILCLTFGFLGLHRLYLGKYLSGLIMFIWGTIDIVFNYFSFKYSFFLTLLQYFWIIIDLFLSYYGMILDGKGKPLEMDVPLNISSIKMLLILCSAMILILIIYVFFDRLFIVQLVSFLIATIIYLVKALRE